MRCKSRQAAVSIRTHEFSLLRIIAVLTFARDEVGLHLTIRA